MKGFFVAIPSQIVLVVKVITQVGVISLESLTRCEQLRCSKRVPSFQVLQCVCREVESHAAISEAKTSIREVFEQIFFCLKIQNVFSSGIVSVERALEGHLGAYVRLDFICTVVEMRDGVCRVE